MSSTAFEILLNRRGDDSEIPDGDFRSAIIDLISFIKQNRGSELPVIDGDSYSFDPLLPSVEEFFIAISKTVDYWYRTFRGYQVFKIENDTFSLDDGIYGIYPSLGIKDGQIDPLAMAQEQSSRNFSPYFHELNRAVLPVDGEMGEIIQMLSSGYPRYEEYGVVLFLLDLVWWGWQTYLGEPDGRGEGDISFVVLQNYGLSNLAFKCYIALGFGVISLPQSVSVNSYASTPFNFSILDVSGIDFTTFAGIQDYGELPDAGVTITAPANLDSIEVTDIIIRIESSQANWTNPLIYSCNPRDGELPLIVAKGVYSKNKFTIRKKILNDKSPTGIHLLIASSLNFAFLFKQDLSSNLNETVNYSLQIFSGAKLVTSQYFSFSGVSLINTLIVEVE